MKKAILYLMMALTAIACSGKRSTISDKLEYASAGNSIDVYTTASGTDMRLSHSTTLTFEAAAQPLESEVAVFVNPERQFQSFLGIGGAITDASAEVFAKLPETKQQELLEAYYNRENGIGYTLAR
ncbi:MAG: glycosyl hydrolase, partial [Calditrichaeota bacterium]|nr:glycosyl hydrolase [Calditrichota bacterium]